MERPKCRKKRQNQKKICMNERKVVSLRAEMLERRLVRFLKRNQETRGERQEPRAKSRETRDKRQEARVERQETRDKSKDLD